jgi:hypothetical protein
MVESSGCASSRESMTGGCLGEGGRERLSTTITRRKVITFLLAGWFVSESS